MSKLTKKRIFKFIAAIDGEVTDVVRHKDSVILSRKDMLPVEVDKYGRWQEIDPCLCLEEGEVSEKQVKGGHFNE